VGFEQSLIFLRGTSRKRRGTIKGKDGGRKRHSKHVKDFKNTLGCTLL
jgi:hypothetical protein